MFTDKTQFTKNMFNGQSGFCNFTLRSTDRSIYFSIDITNDLHYLDYITDLYVFGDIFNVYNNEKLFVFKIDKFRIDDTNNAINLICHFTSKACNSDREPFDFTKEQMIEYKFEKLFKTYKKLNLYI